jgi:hypothetical protein
MQVHDKKKEVVVVLVAWNTTTHVEV